MFKDILDPALNENDLSGKHELYICSFVDGNLSEKIDLGIRMDDSLRHDLKLNVDLEKELEYIITEELKNWIKNGLPKKIIQKVLID